MSEKLPEPAVEPDDLRGVMFFADLDETGMPLVSVRAWYRCLTCAGTFEQSLSFNGAAPARLVVSSMVDGLGPLSDCPKCGTECPRINPAGPKRVTGPPPSLIS